MESFKVKSLGGLRLEKYVRTVVTFKMYLYFGREDFNSNTTLRKHTMGWAPNELLLGNVTMAQMTLFEEYDRVIQCSKKIDSNLYTGTKEINTPLTAKATSFLKVGSVLFSSAFRIVVERPVALRYLRTSDIESDSFLQSGWGCCGLLERSRVSLSIGSCTGSWIDLGHHG